MAKQRRQSPGVAGGTIDIPRHTTTEPAPELPAGRALARRKHAGLRARKLAARRSVRSTRRP